jgi:hypothetical protein
MAPAGRVNGALFTEAPGPGCPGPTRTHPGPAETGETGRHQRWRDTEIKGEMEKDTYKGRFRAEKTQRRDGAEKRD